MGVKTDNNGALTASWRPTLRAQGHLANSRNFRMGFWSQDRWKFFL